MNRFRKIVRQLGLPDAISWPAFWVTFAAALIGNLISNTSNIELWLRLAILAVGHVTLWLPLFLLWLALRKRPDVSRPGLVIMVGLFGLALRAVVVGSAFYIFVDPAAALWSQRFVGALLNVGLSFVVTAYIVTVMRERRRHIAELRSLQGQLATSLEQVEATVSRRNTQTVEQVRAVLVRELEALDTSDATGSLATLQYIAADVVRPMSHELANSLQPSRGHAAAMSVHPVPWRDIVGEAAQGRPFRVVATGALLGVEVLAAIFAYPPGVMPLVAGAVVAVALYALANVVLARLLRGKSQAVRILFTIAAALCVSVFPGIGVARALGSGAIAVRLGIGIAFFSFVFGLGTAVAAAATRDRERVLRELASSSNGLKRRLVLWQQAHWFQQRALSRALHGPVQSAVTAAAIRLDAAMRSGQVSVQLIERVQDDLLRVIDVLNDPNHEVSPLAESLNRVVGTWEGLCTVDVDVDEQACISIDSSPVLRSCVIELVSEVVSNAVRHAGSTRARVRIADRGFDAIDIIIDTDGGQGEGESRRGLGTQLLDECTLVWQRDSTDSGQRLVATLPVGAAMSFA